VKGVTNIWEHIVYLLGELMYGVGLNASRGNAVNLVALNHCSFVHNKSMILMILLCHDDTFKQCMQAIIVKGNLKSDSIRT
jgi:hypothetical protein